MECDSYPVLSILEGTSSGMWQLPCSVNPWGASMECDRHPVPSILERLAQPGNDNGRPAKQMQVTQLYLQGQHNKQHITTQLATSWITKVEMQAPFTELTAIYSGLDDQVHTRPRVSGENALESGSLTTSKVWRECISTQPARWWLSFCPLHAMRLVCHVEQSPPTSSHTFWWHWVIRQDREWSS